MDHSEWWDLWPWEGFAGSKMQSMQAGHLSNPKQAWPNQEMQAAMSTRDEQKRSAQARIFKLRRRRDFLLRRGHAIVVESTSQPATRKRH